MVGEEDWRDRIHGKAALSSTGKIWLLKTQSLPEAPGHFDGSILFPGSYPAHRPFASTPALIAISQWALKARLASPLPGPTQTSRPPVNGATSLLSNFACCLGLALPARVLYSPPTSPLRSQQFWLLSLVSRG